MTQLAKAIAKAIRSSGEKPAAIARGADVARSQLSRLLNGERGLNTETADRIAAYLGLEIVVRARGTKKGKR